MLDLSSLIILAGLFMGLVVGDAALFGDPVTAQISVPSKVADAGFSGAAAEQVFAAQVGELAQVISIVPTPSVQISTRPTVLAAMAKPLSLDNVVIALQTQAGFDVVTVRGVVVADASGKGLDMVTVVTVPREIPVQIRLTQDDGDATVLVQRTAEAAMEWISPYRLALTQFALGLRGDPKKMQNAKDVAQRVVARSWVPQRATEQVMMHNLLAMMASLDNDTATMKKEFDITDGIPDALPAAHGVVELNRCFLALADRQIKAAEAHYENGRQLTAHVTLAGWRARLDMLAGLVAWAQGRTNQAEALLRASVFAAPENQEAHHYLAELLQAKGDLPGAAAERAEAANSRRYDAIIPAEAQSLFWVDPINGGVRRRS